MLCSVDEKSVIMRKKAVPKKLIGLYHLNSLPDQNLSFRLHGLKMLHFRFCVNQMNSLG